MTNASLGSGDIKAHQYWSRTFGHLGPDQIVFAATKPV